MYVTDPHDAVRFDTGGDDVGVRSLPPRSCHSPTAGVVRPLDHCPQAVGAARRLARELLERWVVPDADSVTLVVSELVTNAVEHALPPLVLHLHRDPAQRRVWVGVSDGGPAPHDGPWTSSCTDEEHGRGLGIVEALTDVRETDTLPDGTAIHWARLAAA
ncbi:ATP-binding protein [Streptomyces sp. NPDC054861]